MTSLPVEILEPIPVYAVTLPTEHHKTYNKTFSEMFVIIYMYKFD
mgnify:CR=1 FL=1